MLPLPPVVRWPSAALTGRGEYISRLGTNPPKAWREETEGTYQAVTSIKQIADFPVAFTQISSRSVTPTGGGKWFTPGESGGELSLSRASPRITRQQEKPSFFSFIFSLLTLSCMEVCSTQHSVRRRQPSPLYALQKHGLRGQCISRHSRSATQTAQEGGWRGALGVVVGDHRQE